MSITIDGLTDTLRSVQGLEADLRKQTNGELRKAAGECATLLATDLRGAASSAATPVSRRVAESIKVKSDRLPSVSIGGSRRVGRYGAPASALVWGSEHGGHNFAAGESGGYWIKPTVERFEKGRAIPAYKAAVVAILHARGLL
jgi:hypothetical protein